MAIIHSRYRESGTVTIDAAACTKCGACVRVCAAGVLEAERGCVPAVAASPLGCIACGQCMMVCPAGAVKVCGRGISPDDLVPLPEPGRRADADSLAALMLARRSVRRFDEREVEPELLERVVDLATTAPMGIPPWDVGCVAVRGRADVRRLAAGVIAGYEGFLKMARPWLLAALRPFVGQARYETFAQFIRPLAETYVRAHRAGRDALFYDAPALLVFHQSPYADPADAVIACTYAMLAAESLGLGSTIIGGAPPILQRNAKLCRSIGIPAGQKPSVSLILGHPAVRFRHAIRRRFVDAAGAAAG